MSTTERQFPQPQQELVYYQSLRDPDESLVLFDGKTYRHQDVGPNGPTLDSFNAEAYIERHRLRMHDCVFGEYPWDHWNRWALADGVPEDLALLGCDLIREADQHCWSEELQAECGWQDSGAAMIQLALTAPDETRKRWEHLMETDGERGSWDAETGDWIESR